MIPRIPLQHPRFHWVQRNIFTLRVVADCMTHSCKLVQHDNREKLDACCQYGVDVDISERDGILAHREQIASLLTPDAAASEWFTREETRDPDFPTGRHVRTNRHGEGCVFLSHDGRGCAVHRAAIEGNWDMSGVKPHVCRLFPVSYDSNSIVLSDDYPDYSCAYDPDAPTVYRVAREALADIFGDDLIEVLDRAEQSVISGPLRVVASSG